MKRYLLFLILFMLIQNSLHAENIAVGKEVNIYTRLNLQIFEDGKSTENYITGYLQIYDYHGKIRVSWYDIQISPMHEQKKMLLKPEHNTTEDGSITDVIVSQDHFSFKLRLEPERILQIYGQ